VNKTWFYHHWNLKIRRCFSQYNRN
jgi:hypothetical protein